MAVAPQQRPAEHIDQRAPDAAQPCGSGEPVERIGVEVVAVQLVEVAPPSGGQRRVEVGHLDPQLPVRGQARGELGHELARRLDVLEHVPEHDPLVPRAAGLGRQVAREEAVDDPARPCLRAGGTARVDPDNVLVSEGAQQLKQRAVAAANLEDRPVRVSAGVELAGEPLEMGAIGVAGVAGEAVVGV